MSDDSKDQDDWTLFNAEAAYAESMFRSALGDIEGSIEALEQCLDIKPDYAPAILSMGSIEYQRGRAPKGRALFLSLLSVSESTPDLPEIIDEAGTFLMQARQYSDGLHLYRAAVEMFPSVGALQQGLGCCAGHQGLHDEAIEASRRALDLQPENQEYVNDLGWSLLEAGDLQQAKELLERAVSMDPTDELAAQNLRFCNEQLAKPNPVSKPFSA